MTLSFKPNIRQHSVAFVPFPGNSATLDTDRVGDIGAWTVSDGGSQLKIGFTGAVSTNPTPAEVFFWNWSGFGSSE